MGLDDFISSNETYESGLKSEDNGLNCSSSCPDEAECRSSTSQIKKDISKGDNVETFAGNDLSEEGKHMQTDYEVDLMQTHHVLQENVKLVECVTIAEDANRVDQESDNDYMVTTYNCTIRNLLVGESQLVTTGVKRARMEYVDQHPSVHVVYSFLTRESKKKLMELMQQWSQWHAQSQSSSSITAEEALYGEEIYYPALHVGQEKSSTVSFWFDNQTIKEGIENKLDNDSVPLYDRGCTLFSSLPDGSTNLERIGMLEASRCFNCGSYNHSLKECLQPRDNVAIDNARKQHNLKRNLASGSRTSTRYYQKSPGKFDDLRAGILGPETRECLGIGEFDPPPWLHRMREIGYPPGYLDVDDEDQPSGIEIYGMEEKVEYEDGELPERGEPQPPEKKMTVEFPGINAPIPENADPRLWAPAPCGFSGSRIRSYPIMSRPMDTHRGPYPDQRWSAEHNDTAPPGTVYGLASSTPDYSPRYHPYDNAAPRSPSLGRSPGHSPHNRSGQSPQYHSPVSRPDRWNHEHISSQQSRGSYEHRHHRRT